MSAPLETTAYLTTGQVAARCGVNFRTVIRWIQKGYLKAHRLPGRGDHRVSMKDFLAFAEHNQMVGAHEPAGKALTQSSNKVLIVDDDPLMARSIERSLLRAGCETAIANDGFRAGLLLHSFSPALITLDLKMTGIDGFDVLSLIRKSESLSHIKILVVSGDTETRLEKAMSCGADDVLPKPFDNQVLLSKVERLLNKGEVYEKKGPDR